MTMKKFLLLLLTISILGSCAASYDNGQAYPRNLFYERFPSRTEALFLSGSTEVIRTENRACFFLGQTRVSGAMGSSLDEINQRSDMTLTARVLDAEPLRRAANA